MGLNLKTSGISRTFGVFEERTRENTPHVWVLGTSQTFIHIGIGFSICKCSHLFPSYICAILQVDMFCLLTPLYLRRRYLKQSECSLAQVLRAEWLLPSSATIRVCIPVDSMSVWPLAKIKKQVKEVCVHNYMYFMET
jgi:hypothetical protein